MAYNIRRFLFCFILGISLGVYVLSLVFLYYNDKSYAQEFTEALNKSLVASSEKISRNVVSMCNLSYTNTARNADEQLNAFSDTLSSFGEISVVDEEGAEYTYSESSFESNPVLKFGDLKIRNNPEIDALLNNMKSNSDCDFAIYLKINADSDLLNIVNTASDLGDIYTPESVIFRVGEDGRESRVINRLLLGEKVDELIALPNTYIYIRYIPIVATTSSLKSKFIGAIAYYAQDNNLNNIYGYLKGKGIKQSGYYWIMEDLRNGDYRYKLSKGSSYDGYLLSENEGTKKERDYITNLTLNARFLRSGESSTDFVKVENSDDEAIVSYLYFEPWNWIIGTTSFKSEIQNFTEKVPTFASISIYYFLGLLLLILFLALILPIFLAMPISSFFEHIRRNFGLDKRESPEKFKSVILDFKVFVKSLEETRQKVDSFSEHLLKSKREIGGASEGLKKNKDNIDVLSQKQFEDAKESQSLINSMYALSEKLTEFSENYKVDAKTTLGFTRQKVQSLKALRRESELLKDIGGGFASRFLRIRNIIEKLSAQLEELKNYADKTKRLSENMESEINKNEGEHNLVFSSLVEDTNKFYGETSVSILTMKNFLLKMRQSIESTISEMRELLYLIENGLSEIDDILEKISTIVEQIATQQSRFQEISRGASMQAEAILQILKIINELKRYTESTREQIPEFESILRDLEKFHKGLD